MECVFGLVGDGFAIIASETSAVHSILVHKSYEDKVMILDSHKLMGGSGEPETGSFRSPFPLYTVHFTEYIQKNVALYQFRNGIPLTTAAAANFTRGELATALRKNPYFVNIILAGHDKDTEPHYHRGMSLEDAINLVDMCIMEIRSRLVVAPPNFVIKIVDEKGAREFAWREFIKDAATGLPAA
ncbi:hypothetical protein Nepgr_033697 [Nepenthes gracilis]|uniref:Proteasome subunit beta n=1 Tax=Nepenthes gracilis TaxID=150966 RepID=A0AAD3TMV0_NEPGR|nr:hypothetical protein Nepgr_033697 [Nepenthes gracilis]